MNLRSLEYLVALADHRHFGRAAEAVFVTQPTLSAQIKKLETELGVELVERRSRGMLLTDVGERVVARARVLLAEADNIRMLASLSTDPEAGSLRLGAFPTLGPYLLPHVLPEVRRRFPRLELLLVEEKSEVLLAQLREGRLDAALLAMPNVVTGLHEEPLFDEEFLLAVPTAHRLAAERSVPTAALAGESVLLLDEGHCLRDQALSVCQMAGAGERNGFRATSLETLRQMVASGTGVTLLPRLSVSSPVPDSPDIALVGLGAPAPSRRIALYWRTSSVYAGLLHQLADVFREFDPTLVHPVAPKVVEPVATSVAPQGG
ncbi:MAG TPA: LysR substrate-binding domain-containing protein [Ilumatobacter sp.]|nr:LysR substrate-binding domain-containing protein [Ilumatobacter sp.]